MSERELQPCPFCGGKGSRHENDWCEPSEWNVSCLGCGCSTGGCTTKDMAIAAWNKRAPVAKDQT
jgi:Lar family restriction alleviation protein